MIPAVQQNTLRTATESISYGRIGAVQPIHRTKGKHTQVTEERDSRKILADLIVRAQQGDNLAMEAIYQQFRTPLFNLAYRYTYDRAVAEDLLHDIFVKIFGHIHTLDREKAFVGWIYRVAINTCLSYLRSKKTYVSKSVPLDDIENLGSRGDNDVREKVLNKPLDEAIQALSGKLKSVFLMHDLQGYKHEEIAEILGWSIGTSKSQLFKARMKIRNSLKNKELR
ncbi:RNA polymerase sigma factor [Acidobacteriota bacterium]